MNRLRYPKEILDALAARARESLPGECAGVISGVRTRRGVVEVVALHELSSAAGKNLDTDEKLSSTEKADSMLLIDVEQQSRLMDCLASAGTPVVCVYRSRVRSRSETIPNESWVRFSNGKPAFFGIEYLLLRIGENNKIFARAFSWDGRTFVGRDIRIGG